MRDDVMAKKIDVKPPIRFAADCATERVNIKRLCAIEIVNRNRKVKQGLHHGCLLRS
jgi:hypothetical protein